MKILFATTNNNKLKEMKMLLGDRYSILGQQEVGIFDEVAEDGTTFEENAIKKAKSLNSKTDSTCIAEDSGLVVNYLGGAPGVFTARYAALDLQTLRHTYHSPSNADNMQKLIGELDGVPFGRRSACFVCAIALVVSNKTCRTFVGKCDGKILFKPVGNGGFGYDSIFYVEKFDCSMAQLELFIKNTISHRAAAVRKLREVLDGGIQY